MATPKTPTIQNQAARVSGTSGRKIPNYKIARATYTNNFFRYQITQAEVCFPGEFRSSR